MPDFKPVVDMGLTEGQQLGLVQEMTTRAVSQIYPSADALTQELTSGRRLTTYMGIDPTAPDIHVGHASQLMKLGRMQQLGHEVVLLIGDFTAMIGDPTDKSAARVQMTRDQVLENAAGYREQAGKILDIDNAANPVRVAYNSEWLGKMSFADVVELASEVTVQQMLARKSFKERVATGRPVGVHEFLYPLMQGYDSVALDVDVEVGGSDQIFNMLVGSEFVRRHQGKQKYVVAGDLLVDPTGRKIGKTEGNMITLNDTPTDMFQKAMLWGDEITPHALELCSNLPMAQIEELMQQVRSGEISGLDAKKFMAHTLVSDLHSPEAADQAQAQYEAIASRTAELDPALLGEMPVQDGQGIVDIIVGCGLAQSKSAARRLLQAGAVRINGDKVDETWLASEGAGGSVLQVGKRQAANHRVLTFGKNKE